MSVSSRSRRIFEGWSANLFLLLLGITQQVALVPIFLHFWSGETLAAQLGEVAAIVTTGSLLGVVIAYVALQVLVQGYLVFIDAHRRFPFLRRPRARWHSWRWTAGQFRRAFPYALANSTELA